MFSFINEHFQGQFHAGERLAPVLLRLLQRLAASDGAVADERPVDRLVAAFRERWIFAVDAECPGPNDVAVRVWTVGHPHIHYRGPAASVPSLIDVVSLVRQGDLDAMAQVIEAMFKVHGFRRTDGEGAGESAEAWAARCRCE